MKVFALETLQQTCIMGLVPSSQHSSPGRPMSGGCSMAAPNPIHGWAAQSHRGWEIEKDRRVWGHSALVSGHWAREGWEVGENLKSG